MIIKDERDLNLEFFYNNVGTRVKPTRNLDHIQLPLAALEGSHRAPLTTSWGVVPHYSSYFSLQFV
jgi:hypothetical protein